MITHKSASAANLAIKVRRYQTFEVSQTSKVYNRCGFNKIWVITARVADLPMGAFQNWGRHCKTRRIANPAPKRGSPGRIRNPPGQK
jgi:hypothetical protein